MEGKVLEVPKFIPSLHKSSRQFGFSFVYDAPKVWNEPKHSRFYCVF